MGTLTSKLLDAILDTDGKPELTVEADEVLRFDDDTSRELQLGQSEALVATADFRLTTSGLAALVAANQSELKSDLAKANAEPLFSIDNTGEITTTLPFKIDDSVTTWLAAHYDFNFRIRGVERAPFAPYRRERVDADKYRTIYPWLQVVNTLAVRGDLIEIEVSIDPVSRKRPRARGALLTKGDWLVPFDDNDLIVKLVVEGNYDTASQLVKHNYWITLHSDDGPDLRVAVNVGIVAKPDATTSPTTPPAVPPPQPTASGGTSSPSQS
jgi:hypothetical protein